MFSLKNKNTEDWNGGSEKVEKLAMKMSSFIEKLISCLFVYNLIKNKKFNFNRALDFLKLNWIEMKLENWFFKSFKRMF